MEPNGAGTGLHNEAFRVTKKSSRSYRSSILHTFLRGFGNSLIKPGKPTGQGSPDLRADEEAYKRCNIRQRVVEDIRLYDLNARSLSTSENFIPAYLYSLTLEQNPAPLSERSEAEVLAQIKEHDEQKIISHDFAARQKGGKRRKQIYYFCGGAWQSKPSPDHWKFCAHLAHRLTARGFPTTVTIVSYPLAPQNPFSVSFPMLEKLYNEILPPYEEPSPTPTATTSSTLVGSMNDISLNDHAVQSPQSPKSPTHNQQPSLPPTPTIKNPESTASLRRYRTAKILPNEEIILMGDSAGANVVLSLTLHMLQHPLARPPDSLFLISPAVDLRHTNPAMAAIEKNDPILNMKYVTAAAQAWMGGGVPPTDPRVSPLLSPNIAELAKRNVTVNGVTAGFDILSPDAVLFREKCREHGVRGEWLEWDKQMHCFPLAFSYKVLPDSMESAEWVLDTIQGRNLTKAEKDKEATLDVKHNALRV